jgi:hypothetical protein
MPPANLIEEVTREFTRMKSMADKAIAQVPPEAFFATLDPESNSLAVIMKHLSGNLRSRWTDVLTTDGEKPDRHRDSEFATEAADSREAILARWETGWRCLFQALASLTPADLDRNIRIKGEPTTLLRATVMGLSHSGQHVGQLVLLAKHLAGERWQTLSVPRAKSPQPAAPRPR